MSTILPTVFPVSPSIEPDNVIYPDFRSWNIKTTKKVPDDGDFSFFSVLCNELVK